MYLYEPSPLPNYSFELSWRNTIVSGYAYEQRISKEMYPLCKFTCQYNRASVSTLVGSYKPDASYVEGLRAAWPYMVRIVGLVQSGDTVFTIARGLPAIFNVGLVVGLYRHGVFYGTEEVLSFALEHITLAGSFITLPVGAALDDCYLVPYITGYIEGDGQASVTVTDSTNISWSTTTILTNDIPLIEPLESIRGDKLPVFNGIPIVPAALISGDITSYELVEPVELFVNTKNPYYPIRRDGYDHRGFVANLRAWGEEEFTMLFHLLYYMRGRYKPVYFPEPMPFGNAVLRKTGTYYGTLTLRGVPGIHELQVGSLLYVDLGYTKRIMSVRGFTAYSGGTVLDINEEAVLRQDAASIPSWNDKRCVVRRVEKYRLDSDSVKLDSEKFSCYNTTVPFVRVVG